MSRFKVGDKVYMRHDPEEWGIISEICEDNYKHPYVVKTEHFEEMYAERELLGAKEAFLERLQKLLREFDAKITFDCRYEYESCETIITIGDTSIVRKEVYGVTADSIMDFDKE